MMWLRGRKSSAVTMCPARACQDGTGDRTHPRRPGEKEIPAGRRTTRDDPSIATDATSRLGLPARGERDGWIDAIQPPRRGHRGLVGGHACTHRASNTQQCGPLKREKKTQQQARVAVVAGNRSRNGPQARLWTRLARPRAHPARPSLSTGAPASA